ncbi:MAG: rod shape-determining protein MreD [Legionellales bacterium RIFCSPHIGHO2_12_FULL_35_11]|nr:MAG: rod shape-determining protein MreD [Legionellales bacterium RIFCSPHIGHO2_12_FULL_35_11]
MNTINTKLFSSLILVFVLTIVPLPDGVNALRPAWVLVFILYIQCCLPEYFRITWVFLLGLCLDVLCGSAMGFHSLALLATAWIASGRGRGFEYYSIAQQMSVIVLFCLVYQFFIYLLDAYFGIAGDIKYVFGSSFLSVLVWPWLRFFISPHKVAVLKNR